MSECKVCGAKPDATGERVHGKGCFEVNANGGGSDWPDTGQTQDAELNPDITPYDLAERLCAGRIITETGKKEIAHELRMVQSLVTNMQAKINDGACNTDDLIEFVGKLVKRVGFNPGDL